MHLLYIIFGVCLSILYIQSIINTNSGSLQLQATFEAKARSFYYVFEIIWQVNKLL
jgi:hypothetical protein